MRETSGLDLFEQNAEQEAIAQARAEERRQGAIQLVNSIYRLIKVLGIHAESNQAVAVLVNATVTAVKEYCERAGSATASVLFADDTIFVNGQMLRVSRDAYTTGVALGALFERCGISEVTFQSSLEPSQAMEFARVMHTALRDRSLAATTVERVIPGVKLRRIDGRAKDGEIVEEIPLTQRIAHTYAASIVIMRALHDDLSRGQFQLPHRIKRVAQKLVKDAEEAPHILLSLVTARASGSDEASLAVGSAALSILMARQLTNDRALLANLAITALLFDVGRHTYGRPGDDSVGAGIGRVLNEDELDRLPAATAAILTVLGRIHTAAITRTVVSFEALWQRRAARLGPLYGGRRTPMLLSRLIATARTFTELVTPTPTVPALAIDDAVHLMNDAAATEIDRACNKLLVATLGFFPVGTVVELSTGELAIVTAVPALASQFARPPVRIMYDESGNLLPTPLDLDLAAPSPPGQPVRFVRRTIEYDAQQMRAMRSFILSSIEGKAPANHPALLRPSADPASESATSQPQQPAQPVQGKRVVAQAVATRQVDWEDYKKLATPQPRIVTQEKTAAVSPIAHAAPAPPAATRQVNWEDYKKIATPQPRVVGEEKTVVASPIPPPGPAATRQVNWEDYKKIATPQPRVVGEEKTVVASPIPPPGPAATRQVNWEDYKKIATPQPRMVGEEKTVVASPIPPPGPAATRQVNWEDYKKLATPQPRIVAPRETPSRPGPTAAPEPARTSEAKPATQPRVASFDKADAATRQVNWDHYHRIKGDQPNLAAPAVEDEELRDDTVLLLAGVEQDDTDLLLAGVEQDHTDLLLAGAEHEEAPSTPRPDASDVEDLFKAFLSEEPFPPSPSSPPPPQNRAQPPSGRWSATEALLRELEDTSAPKRPLPPRPGPKRGG